MLNEVKYNGSGYPGKRFGRPETWLALNNRIVYWYIQIAAYVDCKTKVLLSFDRSIYHRAVISLYWYFDIPLYC